MTFERAIAVACDAEREIAAGRWRGPLHGVPFALKDVFDTAGIPTTAQSRIAIDRVPTADATVTARLHQAGALLIGKLALHEFAHGGPSLDIPWPNARNPWNPLHFAGSSGSGSAVAVAAGFVPAAMGTDTGGSIRIPAGLCGIAGLKPTFGLVSRRGVIRARRASIIAARWHGPRRTARFCCRRLPAMTPQILRVATSAFQITRRS